MLRDRTKGEPARLVAAGYLPPEHQPYLEEIRRKMREWGLEAEFEYRGEVDRAQKTAFLQIAGRVLGADDLRRAEGHVPARGDGQRVPVVQPRHGAFPEMVSKTGGGVIVEPDNPSALADAYLELWRNPERATALGRAGAAGVREHYDVGRMAEAAEQRLRVGPQRTLTADMLIADRVSKSYRTPRGDLPILNGVSLSLARGAAVAIMGPSGSGKSTLLYILGALDPPSSGTVTLDGHDPYKLGEREQAAFRNERIGFVFQDHSLLPQCSVLENVLAPTFVAPRAAQQGEPDAARARALLAEVGLADRLEHRPAELSGGEKQRAALARALIRRPELLLCDEPTGNLDRAAADSVAELLLKLHAAQNTILVVVTHSAALAERFPVRYEMNGGTLVKRWDQLPTVQTPNFQGNRVRSDASFGSWKLGVGS